MFDEDFDLRCAEYDSPDRGGAILWMGLALVFGLAVIVIVLF